jgi:molybdopterin converting factor small subunit
MRPFLLATALALSLSSSPWTLTPSSMSVALSVAIDDAYAPEDAVIPAGGRVAIIPPVSGG